MFKERINAGGIANVEIQEGIDGSAAPVCSPSWSELQTHVLWFNVRKPVHGVMSYFRLFLKVRLLLPFHWTCKNTEMKATHVKTFQIINWENVNCAWRGHGQENIVRHVMLLCARQIASFPGTFSINRLLRCLHLSQYVYQWNRPCMFFKLCSPFHKTVLINKQTSRKHFLQQLYQRAQQCVTQAKLEMSYNSSWTVCNTTTNLFV